MPDYQAHEYDENEPEGFNADEWTFRTDGTEWIPYEWTPQPILPDRIDQVERDNGDIVVYRTVVDADGSVYFSNYLIPQSDINHQRNANRRQSFEDKREKLQETIKRKRAMQLEIEREIRRAQEEQSERARHLSWVQGIEYLIPVVRGILSRPIGIVTAYQLVILKNNRFGQSITMQLNHEPVNVLHEVNRDTIMRLARPLYDKMGGYWFFELLLRKTGLVYTRDRVPDKTDLYHVLIYLYYTEFETLRSYAKQYVRSGLKENG